MATDPSPLRVIGAGLPRTGTTSLKAALEQLLGGRCYHMFELFQEQHAGLLWYGALHGDLDALRQVLADFDAAIDWPSSLFWRELHEMYPEAVVVLSHRGTPDAWWESVNKTVWAMMRRPDSEQAFAEFNRDMRLKCGLGADWDDPTAAKQMYQALYDQVVATVPAEQLVVWQPSDGWEPLCNALQVPTPHEPFPHHNTRSQFRKLAKLDAEST